jgi:hypothetical protein
VLNDIALLPDAASRLDTAERAREAWSSGRAATIGYRAREVREMLGMLDEVIAELRVAAGQDRFDLVLTADAPTGARCRTAAAAGPGEVAEQLLLASRLAATPAERQSLLRTLLGVLDRAVDLLPASIAARLRGEATGMLAEERRLERAYGDPHVDAGSGAAVRRRADVRSLERFARGHVQRR